MSRKIDFRELLFKEGMQVCWSPVHTDQDHIIIVTLYPFKDVGLAVLGTLIEPLSKTKKSIRVNYSLLETNRKGEIHSVPISGEVSTLEAIVYSKDMVGVLGIDYMHNNSYCIFRKFLCILLFGC